MRKVRGVMMACIIGTGIQAARAQDAPPPGEIAERCIEEIRSIAGNTVYRMHRRANRCIHAIGELLADGNQEEAEAAAEECTHKIRRFAKRRTRKIFRLADECVSILHELGAPQLLIDAVRGAAAHAAQRVREHRDMEVHRIMEALNG